MKNTGTLYRSTEKTPTVFPEFRDLLPPLSQEQQEALEKVSSILMPCLFGLLIGLVIRIPFVKLNHFVEERMEDTELM